MQKIYFDHAATTQVKPEVLAAMLPYLNEAYGNASSIHWFGQKSKKAIEDSREKIANIFNAQIQEIFFTSSGTEADNWAIKGLAFANQSKGRHIITSSIEHHAILNSCHFLERNGFDVTYLPVDSDGLISISDLNQAIKKETILISIMFANNEVGTIQPITEISAIAKKNNIIFHTDAVQAIANLKIDVKQLGIDAMSFSGHKFYAPKGVGGLFLRSGIKIENLLHGGSQERGLRSGTENVAGIVAMAKALELITDNLEAYQKKLLNLRNKALNGILNLDNKIKLNGHKKKRLPGNLNLSFPQIAGDSLLLKLDMNGIAASSGSACSALSIEPSHVLLAMGLGPKLAKNSLRLTFGDENNEKEIDRLIDVLREILNSL